MIKIVKNSIDFCYLNLYNYVMRLIVRGFVSIFLVVFFIVNFYGDGNNKKVMIVPFFEESGGVYKFSVNSYSYGIPMSMWASMRFLEGFEIYKPERSVNFNITNICEITNNVGYDYYLVGSYRLSGGKIVYSIDIYDSLANLVWSGGFEKEVREDVDLFEIADELALRYMRGLSGKDVGFGVIVFRDFNLSGLGYEIEINGKPFKKVGDNYSEVLKVPAGNYKVAIKNNRGVVVKVENFSLPTGGQKVISYNNREANVRVIVNHKEKGRDYDIYVDGIRVLEGSNVVVLGGREIDVVVSNYRGEVYSDRRYIEGESSNVIYTFDKYWGKDIRILVGSGSFGLVNVSLSYFVSRYFDMELILGLTPFEFFGFSGDIWVSSLGLGCRYYIVGDSGSGFNMNVVGGVLSNPIIFDYFGRVDFDVVSSFLGIGLGYNFSSIGIPLILSVEGGVSFVVNNFTFDRFYIGPFFNFNLWY